MLARSHVSGLRHRSARQSSGDPTTTNDHRIREERDLNACRHHPDQAHHHLHEAGALTRVEPQANPVEHEPQVSAISTTQAPRATGPDLGEGMSYQHPHQPPSPKPLWPPRLPPQAPSGPTRSWQGAGPPCPELAANPQLHTGRARCHPPPTPATTISHRITTIEAHTTHNPRHT